LFPLARRGQLRRCSVDPSQCALAAQQLDRLEQRQPDRAPGHGDPDGFLRLAQLEAMLGGG